MMDLKQLKQELLKVKSTVSMLIEGVDSHVSKVEDLEWEVNEWRNRSLELESVNSSMRGRCSKLEADLAQANSQLSLTGNKLKLSASTLLNTEQELHRMTKLEEDHDKLKSMETTSNRLSIGAAKRSQCLYGETTPPPRKRASLDLSDSKEKPEIIIPETVPLDFEDDMLSSHITDITMEHAPEENIINKADMQSSLTDKWPPGKIFKIKGFYSVGNRLKPTKAPEYPSPEYPEEEFSTCNVWLRAKP